MLRETRYLKGNFVLRCPPPPYLVSRILEIFLQYCLLFRDNFSSGFLIYSQGENLQCGTILFVMAAWYNQLTLTCTGRSVWMHCKEKKQKNQLAVKCTTRRFTITEIYFQEKLQCNFLVKNVNYWSFRFDFVNFNAQFHRNILGVTSRSAKRISYSELGFASRILHHKFMLYDLWCNVLMSHGC